MKTTFLTLFLAVFGRECNDNGQFFTTAEWDQPTNDGKNHHFNAIANIPLSGSATNWEIEIAFTHTVVDVSAADASARSADEWTTVWIFTGSKTLNGGSFDLTLSGRCWEPDIGAFYVKYCYDVGGSNPTDPAPTTNPDGTTNPGGNGDGSQTVTPPHDLGMCSGPDGIRPDYSEQSLIQFKASSGSELAVTKYDLNEVLHKSILFFEAQRAGVQPAGNRVRWRGDAGRKDGCDVNTPLYGGWFDAGDHVKFGFPMAWSTTVLAWGMIDYESQYRAMGEWDNGLGSIRWTLEYFIRAHTAKFEFVGQVGDGYADHAFWGRPEDMNMNRPTFKIHQGGPGSDLAGETAAALAAGAILFKNVDPAFSAECLKHAKELYEFADSYRGKYTDTINQAADFYNSWNGYEDELVWGAAWLFRATGEQWYLQKANENYQGHVGSTFSWDEKLGGYQVLLAQLTNDGKYVDAVRNYYNFIQHEATKTPKGLVWLSQWGSNRYAANAAFLMLHARKIDRFSKGDQDNYFNFAKGQIHYMLGDSGRSFVCGFGNNPPTKPHHRSSSCPPVPNHCDAGSTPSWEANPFILYGALVGGPDQWDNYNDDRNDYVANEVACDYNAGFQSALAALKSEVV